MSVPRRLARRILGSSAISPGQFFELAYGRPPAEEERWQLDRLVSEVATPSDARAVLLAFEQQLLTTTFQIRTADADLALASLDGFRLWLDGRDVAVSAAILESRSWEPHIERALRSLLRPGDTLVDAGANVGYHTFLGASLVGEGGRVFAFEPDAENCRLLWLSRVQNAADQVKIVPRALDRTPGLRYLVAHVGSNAGLIDPDVDAVRGGRGVFVEAVRLDDFGVDRRVRLLKIDVEGAELSVLEGASGLLADFRPHIIMEFSLEMTQRVSCVEPGPTLQRLLDDFGYRLFLLDRSTDERHLFASVDELLRSWGDPLRIEDLHLEPVG